jgi:pSer/pThr/pTyr-binding forkhead associated (FHA) protein
MQFNLQDVEEIRFTVVQGANVGSRVALQPTPRSVRIGRAADNDIVINDPSVSRSHARVDVGAEGTQIQDLNSAGGVEKMGFRLGAAPEPLFSGDEFKIGGTILRYEVVLKKSAARRSAKPEKEEKKKKLVLPAPKDLLDAATRPLQRIGLRTPTSQLAVVAALGVIVALIAWPRKPGLPPQAGSKPTALTFDSIIGYAPGADQSHLDGAVFEIPTDADGAAVFFKVNAPSGIDVRVRDKVVASQKPSAEWHDFEMLVIPRAIAAQGTPQFTLDNLGYNGGPVDPESARGWGVSRMWLAKVTSGPTLPVEIDGEAQVLEKLAVDVAQDSKDLYRLVTGLRSLTIGYMKVAGQSALLLPLGTGGNADVVKPALKNFRASLEAGETGPALALLGQAVVNAETRLDREFRERMNTLQLLFKRGAMNDAALLILSLEGFIPENTDPRHREVVSKLGTLDGGGRYIYDKTKREAAYREP